MKIVQSLYRLVLALLVTASVSSAFSVGRTLGSSAFVASSQQQAPAFAQQRSSFTRRGDMQMGNMAKFGIFSPAVLAAKTVLGQEKLNKIRGKGISLHSQAISEFAQWSGAYHLRTKLIKKAKLNGDILGFLV
jgi:hypothetical protein